MSKLIQSALKNSPEYLMLYKASLEKKLDYDILSALQNKVKSTKSKFKNTMPDYLYNKLQRYDNNGEWGRNKIIELTRRIYNTKLPANDPSLIGKYLSVEIECVFPADSNLKEFCKAIRANKLVEHVCVKNDGSIIARRQVSDDDSDYDDDSSTTCVGKEVVVTFVSFDTLKSVCALLQSHDVFVNKSCGLHVHFDMRHVSSARAVTTLGTRLSKCVPALKLMLPASRRNNSYCQRAISNGRDRYAAVNLTSYKKHGTLEVRLHSGTIDADKMINWINICSAAMQCKYLSKRDAQDITTIDALLSVLVLPASLANYVRERCNKFNPYTNVAA